MGNLPLAGLSILVVEDELLIAMDVEQLCRDHGAADVILVHALDEEGVGPAAGVDFHAAILDAALGGRSTLGFAATLAATGVPFIFATGHADQEERFAAFPGVAVVGKPYAGRTLIDALVETIARGRAVSGGV